MQLKVAYGTPTQALKIFEAAAVPIDKSRPKRMIITLSVTLIAFVLLFIGALLADNYRDVDWSEIIGSENGTEENTKKGIGFFQRKN